MWYCETGPYLAGKSCSEGFITFSMAISTGLVAGLSEWTDTSLAGVAVWLTWWQISVHFCWATLCPHSPGKSRSTWANYLKMCGVHVRFLSEHWDALQWVLTKTRIWIKDAPNKSKSIFILTIVKSNLHFFKINFFVVNCA